MRRFDAVDWMNLIEEIESMAKREERSWRSCCRQIICHFLMIEHIPDNPSLKHWRKEIRNWRSQLRDVLQDSPGMKAKLDEMFAEAWEKGRIDGVHMIVEYEAERSSLPRKGLLLRWNRVVPDECPYSLVNTIGFELSSLNSIEVAEDYWPPQVARILNRKLNQEHAVHPDSEPTDGNLDESR